MDKWWEKIDKTRHGRPYSELNEGLIYDDFKERLIEDMVFCKITINEYYQKLLFEQKNKWPDNKLILYELANFYKSKNNYKKSFYQFDCNKDREKLKRY